MDWSCVQGVFKLRHWAIADRMVALGSCHVGLGDLAAGNRQVLESQLCSRARDSTQLGTSPQLYTQNESACVIIMADCGTHSYR